MTPSESKNGLHGAALPSPRRYVPDPKLSSKAKNSFDNAAPCCTILSRKEVTFMAKKRKAAKKSKKAKKAKKKGAKKKKAKKTKKAAMA